MEPKPPFQGKKFTQERVQELYRRVCAWRAAVVACPGAPANRFDPNDPLTWGLEKRPVPAPPAAPAVG